MIHIALHAIIYYGVFDEEGLEDDFFSKYNIWSGGVTAYS